MKRRCLYCYDWLENEVDFHVKCCRNFFGSKQAPALPYSVRQMNELALQIVERGVAVPGVQPKLSMSMVKEAMEKADSRLTVVGELGGQYILKPPAERFPGMPENEHLTMRIAEAFGISVVSSTLIRLASGELSYLTRRIDRKATGEKVHMLDMFQITEAFDKYRSSMEKVGKALQNYSGNPMLDKIFFFEIAVFSFLTGNNDMHLKNFSMIESPSGWVLAPAYDLLNVSLAIPEDTEELALTLGGRKRKLKRADFETFGTGLGLTDKQIQAVFKRMFKNKSRAEAWILKSFLSDEMKLQYCRIMEERYAALSDFF